MPSVHLPILTLAVREQRYSCHGCGNCCRDFTVQLREEDLAKLREQQWEKTLGEPVTIEFRGVTYLRQKENGACIFLMDDGLCRIHKDFGFNAKPIACQLFPFHLIPGAGGVTMGINFACQSVLENKGAELRTHSGELSRMTAALPELERTPPPPMLSGQLRATPREADSLADHIDRWLRRSDLEGGLPVRIDGLAWVITSLAGAKLQNVRDQRFLDLLDMLFGALPDELAHYPLNAPTLRQLRMLRQAVFTRTEDPKLNKIAKQGRWRTVWSQLQRGRRMRSGRGLTPQIGDSWPAHEPLESVNIVEPASDPAQVSLISDLMTRYFRASVLAGRCWGAGYYGWSMIDGLQALLLNVACIGWLARLHAAGR